MLELLAKLDHYYFINFQAKCPRHFHYDHNTHAVRATLFYYIPLLATLILYFLDYRGITGIPALFTFISYFIHIGLEQIPM